jgi:hypothetical protein
MVGYARSKGIVLDPGAGKNKIAHLTADELRRLDYGDYQVKP